VPSEGAGHPGHFGHFGNGGLAGLAGREGRAGQATFATEPLTGVIEDHLEEAGRQQDRLADLLQADPAEQPEGWPLRGEILAHVDRLRAELKPGRLPGQIDDRNQVRQPLRALRDRHRDGPAPRGRSELRGRGKFRGRARVRGLRQL